MTLLQRTLTLIRPFEPTLFEIWLIDDLQNSEMSENFDEERETEAHGHNDTVKLMQRVQYMRRHLRTKHNNTGTEGVVRWLRHS